jgi:hypothetical protein
MRLGWPQQAPNLLPPAGRLFTPQDRKDQLQCQQSLTASAEALRSLQVKRVAWLIIIATLRWRRGVCAAAEAPRPAQVSSTVAEQHLRDELKTRGAQVMP